MPSTVLLDIAGRRRSPATLPAFHAGRPPHNKGLRYPTDPPTVEEIIAVMHAAGDDAEGVRLSGLIVVLWRAGPRVSEALALVESDLDSTPSTNAQPRWSRRKAGSRARRQAAGAWRRRHLPRHRRQGRPGRHRHRHPQRPAGQP
jgi:hypothetical protein